MTMRDEFPAIRYRRAPDWSMESQRFMSAAEFEAAGGTAAGWARSPKEVSREPTVVIRKDENAKVVVTTPPKRTRKPRSAAASKA